MFEDNKEPAYYVYKKVKDRFCVWIANCPGLGISLADVKKGRENFLRDSAFL